ncbi:sulfatase-like hydrolase/transferase [Altererythrobacter xixiisoli]|uniref:Sulfatase-like hydrolase/transferase n=1 Tax=Croceibacterium xixiisoli TaxID=1476466 RepID=A0A6I4TTN1_9SPHN|nr:ectonucleotide pyrophosphatase/phosphodiesterase [Croceibacterium xixiisoli]MXO99545.1 sulfatase-like hydrolase/transferase [Croceibacterium xixiisoli]
MSKSSPLRPIPLRGRRTFAAFLLAGLAASGTITATAPAQARTVVMVSIDGMNPEYVTQAEQRGLSMPNLRAIMAEGSHAEGARGIAPTVSWPSAVTLMTGTSPAQHGVLNNERFEPADRNTAGGLYLYDADVKTDTLWHAAARAGLITANVDQLSTVGGTAVHYDIPRYQPSPWDDENRKAIGSAARPAGLLAALERDLGPYNGIDFRTDDYDATRVRYAVEILRRYRPQFLTLHLSAVDVEAHEHAPFSPQANRAAQDVDMLIGQLWSATKAVDPDSVLVVVSDHGQAPATKRLNLRIPLIEAGLITVTPSGNGRAARITDWQADIWAASDAAIMLRDPGDEATRRRVREVLGRLAADPANGIARIIEGQDIAALEGYTGASFVVQMQSGTVVGGALAGDLVQSMAAPVGVHGYLPDNRQMDAAFFITGSGIRAGQNLGRIDIRQIAPTVAQALGVSLRDARQAALPVFTQAPAPAHASTGAAAGSPERRP